MGQHATSMKHGRPMDPWAAMCDKGAVQDKGEQEFQVWLTHFLLMRILLLLIYLRAAR